MKNLKKIIGVFFVLCITIMLVACGDNAAVESKKAAEQFMNAAITLDVATVKSLAVESEDTNAFVADLEQMANIGDYFTSLMGIEDSEKIQTACNALGDAFIKAYSQNSSFEIEEMVQKDDNTYTCYSSMVTISGDSIDSLIDDEEISEIIEAYAATIDLESGITEEEFMENAMVKVLEAMTQKVSEYTFTTTTDTTYLTIVKQDGAWKVDVSENSDAE